MGTRRVVVVIFGKFIVTTVAIATLFSVFSFFGTDNDQIVRICSLQRELGLIYFSAVTGNKLNYKYFWGFCILNHCMDRS